MNLRLCIFLLYGILFSLPGIAQTTASYKLFFEKVYLHTDREHYTAGEDIWLKAYLVNGQTGQLINTSNNLYVELISPEAKIAERKVIRLDKGLGKGDFKLGDSIPSGTYRIRAYTNWMRNFGDNFVFEKSIQVYSDIKQPAELIAEKKPGSRRTTAPVPVPQTKASALAGPSLRFFPEGGSMIEGAAGIVAFKAENASGKGMPAKGSIVSSSGTVLTEFETNETGMGMAMLNPVAAESYYAKGSFSKGGSFNTALPRALLKGFSMYVRNTDSTLRITISTNAATLSEMQNKELMLLFKNRGKAFFTKSMALTELQTALSISKADFPQGISSITLYDASGKPQCERLVYHEGTEKAILTLSTDKAVYSPKGKVTLKIKAADQNGQPVKANLSVSAVDAGLVPANEQSIVSYLNLQSEIKGRIEKAEQYFDESNPKRKQQLDLLLLTQGWRDYTWKRLADSALRISYALEQGITVSGRVREIKKNEPVSEANVTLFGSRLKGNTLLGYRTDSAGRYYFDGLEFYGPQILKLSSRNNKAEKLGYILMDSLFNESIPVKLLNKYFEGMEDELPIKEALLRRAATNTSLNDTVRLKEVTIKASKFVRLWDQQAVEFGYPEESFQIQPQDSVFQSVEHYLSTKLQHSTSIFFAGMDTEGRRIISLPRLFVNGRELAFRTDDVEDIPTVIDFYNTYFQLRMNQVQKIVVKHLLGRFMSYRWVEDISQPNAYVKSPYGGGGRSDIYVIYLTLKPGAMDRREYDIINQPVKGYSEERVFYSPAYPVLNNKQDLRTTIHWEPNITTNEKGEATITYYNADPKTKVRIVAEGVTDSGIPTVSEAAYDVK